MTATFAELTEALGRARVAHEARPADQARERRFLEARAAWLEADRNRLADLLEASEGRAGRLRADMKRIEREFRDRLRAVIKKSKPRRRAQLAPDACGTLFEVTG